LSSRALVASKNFSSSSTARTGRCRMSCKSPSKGARSGSVELHRLCPLFADRTQEDGKQTGRGQAHIPASHALTGQLLRLQWLMARPQPP
jgi:hypothetical protein